MFFLAAYFAVHNIWSFFSARMGYDLNIGVFWVGIERLKRDKSFVVLVFFMQKSDIMGSLDYVFSTKAF